MQISDQIIKVLDDLGARFGFVIDWTKDNIIPQIEQLCAKYITWEIATSVVWIGVGVILIILFSVWSYRFSKAFRANDGWKDVYMQNTDYATVTKFIIGCCLGAIGVGVTLYQLFDIIRCITFPELQVLQYLQSLIK